MSGRARNIIGQLNSNLSNNFSISHTFRQIVWIKWLFCWHYVDNSVFLPVFTPFYPLFKAKHYLITNVCHSNFTHRATRLLYQSRCLKPFCLPIGAQKVLYLSRPQSDLNLAGKMRCRLFYVLQQGFRHHSSRLWSRRWQSWLYAFRLRRR